jgi:hypothetical protein
MKVLIGVDPHKVSVAVVAIDEATGELVERATFPQDRTALRCLAQRATGGRGSRSRLGGAAPAFREARRLGGRAHQGAQGSLHALLRDLLPGGVSGKLSADRAAPILRGIRIRGGASVRLRRRLASEVLRDVRTLDRKIADLNGRIEAEIEASGTTLTKIFGVDPILAARIIGTGSVTWPASLPQGPLRLLLRHGAA